MSVQSILIDLIFDGAGGGGSGIGGGFGASTANTMIVVTAFACVDHHQYQPTLPKNWGVFT